MDWEDHGGPTSSTQPWRVDRRRYRQQTWPSTSSVNNTIVLPWRIFSSPDFGTYFQREVPLFLERPKFSYNIVRDRWKETSVPESSSIRPVVSTKYRLCDRQTDRQTDGQTATANTALRVPEGDKHKLCLTSEPIEKPFCSRNHYLGKGPNPLRDKAILGQGHISVYW